MKRLTLVRHAKSSWSDPSLPDSERPLSSRGERDAPAMAARLAARGERPDLILTSHARRARMTAQAFAARLELPDDVVRVDRRLYLATADALLDLLRDQDDRLSHVLTVGHNPGISEAASRLVPALSDESLPTSAVVAIAVDSDRWAHLEPSVCRLLYYETPKRL